MRNFLLGTILFWLIGGNAAAQPALHPNSESDVLLLYDDTDSELPLTAENIVDSVAMGPTTDNTRTLLAALGNPNRASFLLSDRRPFEFRRERTVDDPRERLERYVRLSYPTEATARTALIELQGRSGVLWAGFDTPYSEAVAPSDPYFPVAAGGDFRNYQWGIQAAYLGLSGAWAQTHGTAYVAVIDIGIQLGHPDLTKAYRGGFARHIVNDSYTSVDEKYMYSGGAGGHGTHVAGIIAANTSLASPPGGYLQPIQQGTAGVCWDCSLIIVKLRNMGDLLFASNIAKAITYSVDTGAQVINLSLSGSEDCGTQNFPPVCAALDYAAQSEIVVTAAVGNDKDATIGFPAKHPATIAVGGLSPDGTHWRTNDPSPALGSNIGAGMETRGILAPAQDVFSTIYAGADWSATSRCGDSYGLPATPGYGTCTGTSMAAPHIAGIAALMRTVNPMRPATEVRALLLASGSNHGAPNIDIGHGTPNASAAVAAAFASNHLTPLFAFKKPAEWLYTVVPQMGKAIAYDTLRPRDPNKAYLPGQPQGNTVPGPNGGTYTFPGSPTIARAEAWVFSTHVNPLSANIPLIPLRRFVKCSPAPCSWNSTSLDHAYSTSTTYAGYEMEGVEGYIYPLSMAQPAGTTTLLSSYNKAIGDQAVFPASKAASMLSKGYDYQVPLGYVYENSGSRPVY